MMGFTQGLPKYFSQRITTSLNEENEHKSPWNEFTYDMNPTTDHFHVPERAIIRSNTKKIQVSNQKNNGVANIGK